MPDYDGQLLEETLICTLKAVMSIKELVNPLIARQDAYPSYTTIATLHDMGLDFINLIKPKAYP